ncbi:Predicted arabinose efflux permease, MFS family [Modicisalibacter ilicicola DSM 19980]|uniref:Predicted arabinose efflux permease, MFS family n=1 Tax=Modicisalibacter ilicicola DSM 19980 TaxID=1121942 RepID=A0A1M4YLZ0_9GAMM|nr:MFS transporter [Halomonas ilicicola]SHF06396.1 Predicted arabinose efflux permease, MFS family [Halomonas ilicicola DSM 19980]
MQNEWLRRFPLAIIVIAQLFGTSLWFSVNGVGLALQRDLGISEAELGRLTLMVQAGFIAGTLTIAATGLADRFRASHIFAFSCLVGALINAGFILSAAAQPMALLLRFLTGVCLAGIYPLGMKMVIGWTPRHTGAALAWLVGMLTLGTALPHLLRGVTFTFGWQIPLLLASGLALLGGALVVFLGDGPHLPASSGRLHWRDGLAAFRKRDFRAVASGYFGHCWELYAFWMLVPFLVAREIQRLGLSTQSLSWLAFAIIALGTIGCLYGGFLSKRIGSLKVARRALACSGLTGLLYPLLGDAPSLLLLGLLCLWGFSVIADSPQFSALAAATAPREQVGSTLAIMNAIGFALTIPAISITSTLWAAYELWVVWLLLPGPALGLWALRSAFCSRDAAPAINRSAR